MRIFRSPAGESEGDGILWLTVRRAVVVAVLLGVMLPAILVGVFISQVISREKLNTQIASTLQHDSDVLAVGIRESLSTFDRESGSALVETIMKDPALVSIEVLDTKHRRLVFREYPERREGPIHLLDRPVLHRQATIGRIRIEISEAPFRQALQGQILGLSGLLCLQVLGSVLLILMVLQRRIGGPLKRLSDEAASLAQGELTVPIVPLHNDEIGQVESRLELTRQALQGLFHSLEHKNRVLEVDLRERMRVESTLRDREQRLRTLVEQSPLAVIEFDLGWHILDWNEAAMSIFGWRREEVLGRHAAMLMATSEVQDAHAQQLDRTEATRRIKRLNRRSDGMLITCQWYNSVIRDASGSGQRIVAMVEDITERQRVDDELRRLATVVRLTNNMVALLDENGRIEWCNKAFEDRCIAPGDAVRGAFLLDRLVGQQEWESDARYLAVRAAINRAEALRAAELPCRTPAGDPFWISLEIQPIRSDNGVVRQWVAVLTDVTDRRHMTEALRGIARLGAGNQARVLLEQLVSVVALGTHADAAYIGLHERDEVDVTALWASAGWPLRGGRCEASRCIGAAVEHTGSMVISSGAFDLVRDDAIMGACVQAEAILVEAIRYGSTDRVVGHLTLLFGTPLASAAEPQSLAELGAARAGVELARLEALEALQHSEQKFFSIFQYSPIPIIVVRRQDGVCLDSNPAFMSSFGIGRDELIGRNLSQSSLCADEIECERLRSLLDAPEEPADAPIRVRTRDGEIRDCLLHTRAVIMDGQASMLLVLTDVTNLRLAQRQVEELNQSLERRVKERTHDLTETNAELEQTLERLRRSLDELLCSEKLTALGSLVSGVTHELNTPIGNSLMVASTLRDVNRSFRHQMETGLRRSVLENYVRESEAAADILMRNLHRAAELLSSFKEVAVNQTDAMQSEFQLIDLVNEILFNLQPLLDRSPITVETKIEPGIWLKCYRARLAQVVANLLSNAIHHAFVGRDKGLVTLSAEMADETTVLLRCADDGVGITPENLRRIFDPFFATRQNRNGTGLGLNVVHNVVTEMLGGDIAVESNTGRGTIFTLRLPREVPASPADRQ